MIISIVWKVVGFGMILFVAGIQAIHREIIEAAMIDGASYWQRVRRIIAAAQLRTILLATLISAIGSMLAFDQFYIMTARRPRGQTFTSVYWIYQNSFIYFKLGYGAALSIILMVIILVGAAVQIALTRRRPSVSSAVTGCARPDASVVDARGAGSQPSPPVRRAAAAAISSARSASSSSR